MRQVFAALFLLLALSLPALAVEPDEKLADPVLEARALVITRGLRCPVCDGQSVDDSKAALAADLRRIVREMVYGGSTDMEVYSFLRARYGDAVLLNPPLSSRTMALRLTPYAVLGTGFLFALVFAWRQNRKGG